MKKLLFISVWVSCILFSISGMAQSEAQEKIPWMIKYDFISLLGDGVTNSMGVKLGVEIPVSDKQAFEFDVMYIFPCASYESAYAKINTEKTNGFMLTAEYRFYLLHRPDLISGFHLGPQVFYQYTKADMSETYQNGIANTYHVYRNLISAHAMVGYQIKIAGPLYFDPAIGFGVRYISSRNENKKGGGSGQHEFIYNKDYESGAQWFPSFTINIKIGFKL
jgi:hypothetical protein